MLCHFIEGTEHPGCWCAQGAGASPCDTIGQLSSARTRGPPSSSLLRVTCWFRDCLFLLFTRVTSALSPVGKVSEQGFLVAFPCQTSQIVFGRRWSINEKSVNKILSLVSHRQASASLGYFMAPKLIIGCFFQCPSELRVFSCSQFTWEPSGPRN